MEIEGFNMLKKHTKMDIKKGNFTAKNLTRVISEISKKG